MKRMVPFFATEGGKIGRVLDSWMNVDNSPEEQFDSRVNEGIELIVKGEFSHLTSQIAMGRRFQNARYQLRHSSNHAGSCL